MDFRGASSQPQGPAVDAGGGGDGPPRSGARGGGRKQLQSPAEVGDCVHNLLARSLQELLEETLGVCEHALERPVAVPVNAQGEQRGHPLHLGPADLAELPVGPRHVGAVGAALLVAGAVHWPEARDLPQPPRERRRVVVAARKVGVVARDGHHGRRQPRQEFRQAQRPVATARVAHKVDPPRVHRKLRADARQQSHDEPLRRRTAHGPGEVPGLVGRAGAGLEPIEVVAPGRRGASGPQGGRGEWAARRKANAAAGALGHDALRRMVQEATRQSRWRVHALVRGRGAVQVEHQRQARGRPLPRQDLGRRQRQEVLHGGGLARSLVRQHEVPWRGRLLRARQRQPAIAPPQLSERMLRDERGARAGAKARKASQPTPRETGRRKRPLAGEQVFQQLRPREALLRPGQLALPAALRAEAVEPGHAVQRRGAQVRGQRVGVPEVQPRVPRLVQERRRQNEQRLAQAPRVLEVEASLRDVDSTHRVPQVAGHEPAARVPQLETVGGDAHVLPGPAVAEAPQRPQERALAA
mmetsp:Transcript_133786/g.416114  ORF Transcript_133786/g.416114 Transcript_133786/m.416114 type:complete len:527 (+) Transcript_133786:66-1646(+)